MHNIPVVMATQHPDNASPIYFHNSAFLDTNTEIEECYRMFADLGCDEYMWDWEGKFVDEAVVDKLFRNYAEFFKQHQLGKDIRLTFRIPNIWNESQHRLIKAFMTIISASIFAQKHDFYHAPIFEVILPMTESSDQLIYLFDTFRKSVAFHKEVFGIDVPIEQISIIPLIEKTEQLMDVSHLLDEYVLQLEKMFSYSPE